MLSVRDIMRTDVVTVAVDDTARALARVLSDSEISGCPVLDANGRLVGVVSATDLVRMAAEESDINLTSVALRSETGHIPDPDDDAVEPDPFGFFLPEDAPLRSNELLDQFPETAFDTVKVGDIMTPVSFSVQPDMPVPELCQYLLRGRIHRALVISDGELLGIVTSQDVLQGVAEERLTV